MAKFKVWDENSSEETACEVEAADADAAVEEFAEDDVDGLADGIYEGGHDVHVRGPSGTLHRFEVTVEYSPTFYVMEMASEAHAAHPPVDVAPDREE